MKHWRNFSNKSRQDCRTKMSFIWMLCQKKTVRRFWCVSAGSGQEEELILYNIYVILYIISKIHIYCRHLNVHIFHWLQMWRRTKCRKTHFAQFVLCPPPETCMRTRAHFLAYTADLQVVLSVTNGVVCFAVMLLPCSAGKSRTSPIRADNDFTPHTCACVCVCSRVCMCMRTRVCVYLIDLD